MATGRSNSNYQLPPSASMSTGRGLPPSDSLLRPRNNLLIGRRSAVSHSLAHSIMLSQAEVVNYNSSGPEAAKFRQRRLWVLKMLNFEPKFPKIVFVGRKYSDKKQRFRQATICGGNDPHPCHDVTARNVSSYRFCTTFYAAVLIGRITSLARPSVRPFVCLARMG